LSAELTETPA